jgi:hypothetical protein
MRLARLAIPLFTAALGGIAHSAPACGQEPASAQVPASAGDAYVRVHVTDAASGGAVADAEVWVGNRSSKTDSLGHAVLQLRRNRETVVVKRIGYDDERREAAAGSTSLEVALSPAPVALGVLRATATAGPLSPSLQRFYQRVERGRGAFLTRDQIDRRKPRRLTDLFREIPGVRVTPGPRGERLMMTGAIPTMYAVNPRWEAGDCPVQYYLDGMSYQPDFAGVPNDVRPDEVEGIEVYRRLSEVPVEFRRPGAECGVVLIWLRERT